MRTIAVPSSLPSCESDFQPSCSQAMLSLIVAMSAAKESRFYPIPKLEQDSIFKPRLVYEINRLVWVDAT